MRTALITFIVIIALLLGFVFFVPHTKEGLSGMPGRAATTTPLVAVHDSYAKGTHTIAGSILAPTACTSASAQASVLPGSASTSPSVIRIAVSMPLDIDICLQEAATTTFSVSVTASKNVIFEATVNGESASTTHV